MRLLLTALAASVCLLNSCADDLFSATVEIPFPEHEPLPALTLDVRAGDTTLYYRITMSRGILELPQAVELSADFSLTRDGAVVDSFSSYISRSDAFNGQRLLATPISPEMGSYEARLRVPGFAEVVARQTMPTVPVVTNVAYEPKGALDGNGDRVDKLEFDLMDDPATEDYYGFRTVLPPSSASIWYIGCANDSTGVVTCDTVYQQDLRFISQASPDPALKQSEGYGLVLTDAAFTNDRYRVRMTFNNYSEGEVELEVYHLTEDAYRFGVSKYAYLDAQGNPFAEPVTVHNNVENGYGYFLLSNVLRVELGK